MNKILDSGKRRQFETGAINPDYIKLAQLAYDIVLQTMLEGEKQHNPDGWKDIPAWEHLNHTMQHLTASAMRDKTEDHIAHALTRCAMIKYLEQENSRQISNINSHEKREE
jgi:hypothetical protein